MTLTSETNRVQYSGNPPQIAFPITFVFWLDSDIQAILTDANGTETIWVFGTHYTLTGGSGATGTLTVKTSPTDYTPASGETLTITSNLDDTQDTSLPEGGAFPSSSVEQQLDKIVRLIQQKAEALGRAIKLSISSTYTDLEIPDPSASKFLRWNSGATALENADVSGAGSIGVPVSIAEGGTNSTTMAAARTALGLAIGTDVQAAGSYLTQGLHTIWVPAAAMRPTVSNGCAALTDVETTAGRPDMEVLDFDATADEHAQFQIAFPKSWDLGTITYQVFWTSTAADTDGVSWGLQGVAVPDNSTIDVVYGTPIVVDDANQSAAEELLVSPVSAAVTIAGTPADDDICYFRIFRDVSDSNDVATEDARLIGVKIFFTSDAADDT